VWGARENWHAHVRVVKFCGLDSILLGQHVTCSSQHKGDVSDKKRAFEQFWNFWANGFALTINSHDCVVNRVG
jgi:hypothetical protein